MVNFVRIFSVCALVLAGSLVFADLTCAEQATPSDPPTVAELLTRDIAGFPNKEALVISVTYLPGGASLPHRHDAQVFVYVLEGTMKMQVDGGPSVTLGAGQTFYEGPHDVHRVSANGSQTEPAKILVFMIKNKGKPASIPLATGGSA